MRDYGKVYTAIWESATFRALTEDGRTLALYLLTCPHGTINGTFRMPDGYACEDLQWPSERVCEGFRNLSENRFATRCETSKWVWVEKYLEWNPPENPNQRKAAQKLVDKIPTECAWKSMFMRVCAKSLGIDPPPEEPKKTEPLPNPSETVSKPVLGTGVGIGAGIEDSVATQRADEPPKFVVPADVVFGLGVPLLTVAGVSDKNARSMLALMCKTHTDQAVADAIQRCATEKPVQPVSWLQAALKPKTARKHAGFDSKDYRQGVNEDGSFA